MADDKTASGETKEQAAVFRPQAAPFLVWPVSRREFYRTICVALLPALVWGVILFGGRVLAMGALAVAASSATYAGMKHGMRWRRARACRTCIAC